jgi:hypothetical protein
MPIVLLSLFAGQTQVSGVGEPAESLQLRSCPTWFERAPRLGPGRPDAVVVGSLRAVTVCRYYGNPQLANGPGLPPNNKLASEKTIESRQTVRSLARAFDRLRPYPSRENGMALCSDEFGGGFYVRFLYSDGRQSSLEVVPSGCLRAVAGKHGDWLMLSGGLRLRLMKVAPLPSVSS